MQMLLPFAIGVMVGSHVPLLIEYLAERRARPSLDELLDLDEILSSDSHAEALSRIPRQFHPFVMSEGDQP